MAKLSPMMQQYLDIKEKHKDSILFFRLGDFYEMFYKDAEIASKELELTLTGRDCGQEERAKMCGVPYHSSEAYIARLVNNGHKVAICEQTEEATPQKKIVNREVTRVVTKGTVIEGSMLDETSNNYLCTIFEKNDCVGVAFCDASTGDIYSTQFSKNLKKNIETELSHYHPSEILFYGNDGLFSEILPFIRDILESSVENITNKNIDFGACSEVVSEQFGKDKAEKIIHSKKLTVYAVGAVLFYLKETQKQGIKRIGNLEIYELDSFMAIDPNTQRNLELTQNMRDRDKKYTLLWVLDKTDTAMGKRLIKSWIDKPLLSTSQIKLRQNAVEELYNNRELSDELARTFGNIFDIERIMTRVAYGSANPKEVRALCSSIQKIPDLKKALQGVNSDELSYIYENIDTLEDIFTLIDSAVEENPPIQVKEGGIIKEGYDEEVDYYRGLVTNSQDLIMKIEVAERERTGIPKLKIGYNRVFGYYIEVTNSYKSMVPEEYIRKQTLSGCERYITNELKEIEGKLLGAKDTSMRLEFVLFDDLRIKISEEIDRIEKTVKLISELDVLNSFAKVAVKNSYCKPTVDNSDKIELINSRHPVIECVLSRDEMFVPNDVLLDCCDNRMNIITGPNMAGKSTYMRQTALIVVMAQIGCFVPAKKAHIGIVNKVFTRVGASDDLAMGRSTFMVEMTEVAQILENADNKSLIIMDEIGRGTSTFDGMSLAQAVVEYISDKKKLGAKTLFATHYHELTELETKLDGVKNYNILVKKHNDDITFLRKIVRGHADDSYGIEVAKLAGVPKSVLKRAKQILAKLESEQNGQIKFDISNPQDEEKSVAKNNEEDIKAREIYNKLKAKDINTFTPIEAMSFLYELIKIAD